MVCKNYHLYRFLFLNSFFLEPFCHNLLQSVRNKPHEVADHKVRLALALRNMKETYEKCFNNYRLLSHCRTVAMAKAQEEIWQILNLKASILRR